MDANELYKLLGELLKRNPDAGQHEVRLEFEDYREEVDIVSSVHIRCEGIGQDINRIILTLRDGDKP